jgi:hypothetical protein
MIVTDTRTTKDQKEQRINVTTTLATYSSRTRHTGIASTVFFTAIHKASNTKKNTNGCHKVTSNKFTRATYSSSTRQTGIASTVFFTAVHKQQKRLRMSAHAVCNGDDDSVSPLFDIDDDDMRPAPLLPTPWLAARTYGASLMRESGALHLFNLDCVDEDMNELDCRKLKCASLIHIETHDVVFCVDRDDVARRL